MVSGVYWSAGARDTNEDSVALESLCSERGKSTLMLVADGIGSLEYGEVISGYVVECFVRWFYKYGYRLGKSAKHRIRRSVNRCAYDCSNVAKKQGRNLGVKWGSTLAMVCIWGHRYVAVHVGDSGIYKISRKGARSIFEPDRNEQGMLLSAIGTMRYCRPGICFGRLRRGDGLLVATDGFLEGFTEEELWQGLHLDGEISDERVDRRLATLGMEVGRRGGTDNRSAVCMYMRR